MTRIILSSLAVVAMLATSTAPAAGQAKLSGQQPVPGEKTGAIIYLGPDMLTTLYLKSTWALFLSTGARNPPPPDCPPPDPIKNCLESWD